MHLMQDIVCGWLLVDIQLVGRQQIGRLHQKMQVLKSIHLTQIKQGQLIKKGKMLLFLMKVLVGEEKHLVHNVMTCTNRVLTEQLVLE